jgi:hypothetical protein
MSELLSPDADRYLQDKGFRYETAMENNMICLVIKDFALPPGYQPTQVDLLIRLPLQFPEVAPDMFWADPPVRYSTGVVPQATELMETYLGRDWQRWSRHFASAQWRPGIDDMRSYLRLIRSTLERERLANAA